MARCGRVHCSQVNLWATVLAFASQTASDKIWYAKAMRAMGNTVRLDEDDESFKSYSD